MILAPCGLVLASAAVALLVKWAPQWLASTSNLSPSERAAEIGRVRTSLLAISAGSIAIVGLIYTARTFALNRQGQVTERFTRAVDQLGNGQIDIRLGGIYALERLAHESIVDHPPIMEILTGFLREHAKSPTEDMAPTPSIPRMATDTQAALSVIARRSVGQDGPGRLDLSRISMKGAQCKDAQLEHLDVHRSDLTSADFTNAALKSAFGMEATAVGIFLGGADLSVSLWSKANLTRAFLAGADLSKAKLTEARLTSAYLKRANLRGADLTGALLDGATLDDAIYDDETTWPDGFDPESCGAVHA